VPRSCPPLPGLVEDLVMNGGPGPGREEGDPERPHGVMIGSAVFGALLMAPLIRRRIWAGQVGLVIGCVGAAFFGWLRLASSVDPEWVDSSHAMLTSALLLALGSAALAAAALASLVKGWRLDRPVQHGDRLRTPQLGQLPPVFPLWRGPS